MIDFFTKALNGNNTDNMALQIMLVFTIFFALIGFWVIRTNLSSLRLFSKKGIDLKSHDFFTNFDRLRFTISNYKTGNPELTRIFKIVARKQLFVVHEMTCNFIDSESWKKMNCKQLEQSLFELLNRLILEYNRQIKESLQKKYGLNKGRAIYDYVMNNPDKGFNTWHSTNLRHIQGMIASILQAGVIHSTTHKMHLILYELLFGLHSGVIDAEKAFYSFNGQLAKILEQPNE